MDNRNTRKYDNYGRFQSSGGIERKWFDSECDDVVGNNGTIVLWQNYNGNDANVPIASVNNMAQGDSPSQREGRKVTIKSIQFRGVVRLANNDQISQNSHARIRVIFYLDKQCNGTTATTTSILESVGISAFADINSYINLANSERYGILMDKTYTLNATSALETPTPDGFINVMKGIKMYKKCNIPILYGNESAIISVIRSNNIGMLCISEGIVDNECHIKGTFRIRYTDL